MIGKYCTNIVTVATKENGSLSFDPDKQQPHLRPHHRLLEPPIVRHSPAHRTALTSHALSSVTDQTITGITPKADNIVGTEKARNRTLVGKAGTKTESSEVKLPPPDDKSNALFATVTTLNDHFTTLHAALLSRTALLLFLGHSDLCSISTLAARWAEYQASQQGNQSSSSAAVTVSRLG
jgi:hypothetical protein